MRKHKLAPQFARDEKRTGDAFVRAWAVHCTSVCAAERKAGLTIRHLHNLLNDPSRGLQPENALKLSRAAGVPVEAIIFRWTPIKDLEMWKWM